jgi:hypothetical protein
MAGADQARTPHRSRALGADAGLLDAVGRGGVEPPTFRFSGGRSYQLSYLPQTALTSRPSGPDGI